MSKSFLFASPLLIAAALFFSACGNSANDSAATIAKSPTNVPTIVEPAPVKLPSTIDIPKLADKQIADFDAAFGKPQESKSIENDGEYRLYRVNGQSRGMAVRFFGGRAKEFNLILDRPLATSSEALRQVFAIDVGKTPPARNPKEPLTETYKGTFGGVKFAKVAAKKQQDGKGFILVLASVER